MPLTLPGQLETFSGVNSSFQHAPGPTNAMAGSGFGRGRARFAARRNNEDEATSMALLAQQLREFERAENLKAGLPPTPTTPRKEDGQFSDAPATPPRTPNMTPHRSRCSSLSSSMSSLCSTPSRPSQLEPGCVCFRRKKEVICRVCGEVWKGRVQRKCPLHANTRYLMDNYLCKHCGIPGLFEWDVENL